MVYKDLNLKELKCTFNFILIYYRLDSKSLRLQKFTISMFINCKNETGFQNILSKVPNSWYGCGYGIHRKSFEVFVNNINDKAKIPWKQKNHINTWVNLTTTYDKKFIKLFIDGELLSTYKYENDIKHSKDPIKIGYTDWSTSMYKYL